MIDLFPDAGVVVALLAASIRLAMPVAFATLGGVVAERSGVYNIGLEGMILTGALGSAIGSYATGSPWGGLFAGVLAGALNGLLLALLAVTFRVNQLVAGIAINLFCLGLTGFLSRAVFGVSGGNHQVPGFAVTSIPGLSSIPIIGPVLFAQDPLVYALLGLVTLTWAALFLTPVGLSLRATGENPRAADSAGVNVVATRYIALTVSGGLAALGGCHLVLSQVFVFSEAMSAGKGFIALAAIILGRWHPGWATLAALFFGFCDAAQFRLQFAIPDVPYQIFQILPFVSALVALVSLTGRTSQPESVGKIYVRESR
jgi:general nucleoside transport system permease protein